MSTVNCAPDAVVALEPRFFMLCPSAHNVFFALVDSRECIDRPATRRSSHERAFSGLRMRMRTRGVHSSPTDVLLSCQVDALMAKILGRSKLGYLGYLSPLEELSCWSKTNNRRVPQQLHVSELRGTTGMGAGNVTSLLSQRGFVLCWCWGRNRLIPSALYATSRILSPCQPGKYRNNVATVHHERRDTFPRRDVLRMSSSACLPYQQSHCRHVAAARDKSKGKGMIHSTNRSFPKNTSDDRF